MYHILAELNTNEMLGWLIGALTTLVGLAVAIMTPIIKLNRSITKLDVSVDNLANQLKRDETQLNKLQDEVAKHGDYLLIDKKRLDNHEMRLSELDKKHGYIDDDDRH